MSDRVGISFTVIEAPTLLTKQVRVKDGELVKTTVANPWTGIYTSIDRHDDPISLLAGGYGLKGIIEGFNPRQALIAAALPSPLAPKGEQWRLRLADATDDGISLPKTAAVFKRSARPGLGFLDIDVPQPLRSSLRTAQDLYEKVLAVAWPGFADAAMLIRPSASAGVRIAGGPDPLPSGWHAFCIVDDESRHAAIVDLLFDRLALMGAAVIEPSKRGSKLKHALVDKSASKGAERYIFEADPVLVGAGMERVARLSVPFNGGILNTTKAIADLTLSADDKRKLAQVWREAEAKVEPALVAARLAWFATRVGKVAAQHQIERDEAEKRVRREMAQFDAGELGDGAEFLLDDGSVVTTYDILTNPNRFRAARTWTINSITPRRGVGFIWPYYSRPDPTEGRPAGPYFHTYEHGGRYFRLRSLRAEIERIERDRERNKRQRR